MFVPVFVSVFVLVPCVKARKNSKNRSEPINEEPTNCA